MFIYHYELCKLIFYIIPFYREISEFYTFCLCFCSFDLEIFGSRLIIHIFFAFKLPPIDPKSFVMCQFNGRSSHRSHQSSFQLSCSLDISARVSCDACVGGLVQFTVLPAAAFGEMFEWKMLESVASLSLYYLSLRLGPIEECFCLFCFDLRLRVNVITIKMKCLLIFAIKWRNKN